MTEKVTGYLLLVAGLCAIVFGALSVYSVFTGSANPYALFNFEGISVPVSTLMGPEFANAGIPDIEIFPAEVLNSTSNTLAHLFLMGFVASIGYKLAMLGVNLVRPIVVKLEGKRLPSVLDPKEK